MSRIQATRSLKYTGVGPQPTKHLKTAQGATYVVLMYPQIVLLQRADTNIFYDWIYSSIAISIPWWSSAPVAEQSYGSCEKNFSSNSKPSKQLTHKKFLLHQLSKWDPELFSKNKQGNFWSHFSRGNWTENFLWKKPQYCEVLNVREEGALTGVNSF